MYAETLKRYAEYMAKFVLSEKFAGKSLSKDIKVFKIVDNMFLDIMPYSFSVYLESIKNKLSEIKR